MPNEAGDDCVSQSQRRSIFYPLRNGCGDAEIQREKVRGRVLERIMTKLRSALESNPGKLGSAVTATPVSETRKIASRAEL